jgi:hypothetical protein
MAVNLSDTIAYVTTLKVPDTFIDPPKPQRDWKAELDRIVEFLNYGDGDDGATSALWNVLSALRGPDEDDHMDALKCSTTAVIRHAIGLKTDSLVICPDEERAVEARKMVDDATTHFIWHAKNAFSVLGLKWTENNGGRPTHKLRLRKIAADAAIA